MSPLSSELRWKGEGDQGSKMTPDQPVCPLVSKENITKHPMKNISQINQSKPFAFTFLLRSFNISTMLPNNYISNS